MASPAKRTIFARAGAVCIRLRCCFALAAGCLFASGGAQAEVVVAGPERAAPALASLAPQAARSVGVAVRVRAGNEGTLLADVSRGTVSLAIIDRDLSAAERTAVEARLIGYNGVAVIVNGRNPVTGLNADQLTGIFAQRIVSWKGVGGADKPIMRILKDASRLPRRAVGSLLSSLGAVEAGAAGAQVVNDDLPAILFVAVDPYAIGYVGIADATKLISEGARVKIVAISGKTPEQNDVRSGAYSLSWPVYLVSSRSLTEEARRMKAFLLGSEGRRILAETGVVLPQDGTP